LTRIRGNAPLDSGEMQGEFRIVGGELGVRQNAVEFELRRGEQRIPIYFRSPEPVLEASREAFLACCVLPAMRTGAGLDLAGPISSRVLTALPRILDIYQCFDPTLQRLSLPGLVPVEKTRAAVGRVGCFFSGGVDSYYTLIKHREEITDVIFVRGFDIPPDDEERWSRAAASVEAAASEMGLGVVHVQTNYRAALRPFADWLLGHGVGMAAVAALLAPVFDRIYIPSSLTYAQLVPLGTHPLLDPLWSTEALELVHDGCEANRVKKVALIADSDTALRYLRVCPRGPEGAYNCGRCEKCVRTMINLEIAGKLAQCPSFDRALDAKSIRGLRLMNIVRVFHEESLTTLRELGLRPDLQRALKYLLLRPSWLDGHRAKRLLRRALPKRLRPAKPLR
jgi:hypothetical protein